MYNLLENKILLVVDDDIINIALIYNYLKSYNANVTYLSNSQEVIPLLEKEKFPREHIGESLIPASYDVLKKLNVLFVMLMVC